MKYAFPALLPILVAASLGLVSCGHDSSAGTQSATSASASSLPRVDVVLVQSKKLKATIGLPAELVSYEAVDLYPRETGFVKSIRVDRGSTVKHGDLIAEIEAPELVAQRAQANAAYQSAESQFLAGRAKLAADNTWLQPRKRRVLSSQTIWISLKRPSSLIKPTWTPCEKPPTRARKLCEPSAS